MIDPLASRRAFRRTAAKVTLALCVAVTISFLAGLFDDEIAKRVQLVWPPFAVIFPSLAAVFGWYMKLGSDESMKEIQ